MHTLPQQMGEPTVAITRHSSSLGMLSGPRPAPPRACLSQLGGGCGAVAARSPFSSDLQSQAWGRRAGEGGVFVRRAFWVVGLICRSSFPLLALSNTCSTVAPRMRRRHRGLGHRAPAAISLRVSRRYRCMCACPFSSYTQKHAAAAEEVSSI